MRLSRSVYGLGICLALACSQAQAGGPPSGPDCLTPNRVLVPPGCAPGAVMPGTPAPPGMAAPPGTPGAAPSDTGMTAAPSTTPGAAFASAGEAGGETAGSFNPTMFGDLIGITGSRLVRVPTGLTPLQQSLLLSSLLSSHGSSSSSSSSVIAVPINSAFKIAENESPRPLDRVFLDYNFYDRVGSALNGPGAPGTNIHFETIGFEKTFMDGNASFGMRLPFYQVDAPGAGTRQSEIGDLTMILKYAFVNDKETGNLISGGVALTVPTGKSFAIPGQSDISDVLIQPYVGFIFNLSRDLYVHGFSSIIVPTDSRDITLLANDIGVGYFLHRSNEDSFLTAIVPTLELHVNTPLNHRGALETPVGFPDVVDITSGVRLQFYRHCSFGMGVGVPITGPKPYNVEALGQLNIAF